MAERKALSLRAECTDEVESLRTGSEELEAAALFVERLGVSLGQEVCLTAGRYSGLELQARTGALVVVDAADVMRQALELAAALTEVTEGTNASGQRGPVSS